MINTFFILTSASILDKTLTGIHFTGGSNNNVLEIFSKKSDLIERIKEIDTWPEVPRLFVYSVDRNCLSKYQIVQQMTIKYVLEKEKQ